MSADVLCFVAMQQFSQSITDEKKVGFLNTWEDTTEVGIATFPSFPDTGDLNEQFVNAAWHRAVDLVATREKTPEGFHEKTRGFDDYYLQYIQTAACPHASSCKPCHRQRNSAFPFCTQFASNVANLHVENVDTSITTHQIRFCNTCLVEATSELANATLPVDITTVEEQPALYMPWIRDERRRTWRIANRVQRIPANRTLMRK